MRKTKKITATLAIVAMMLTMIPMQAFAAGTDDTRIAGTSRIQTAIAAADAGWTSADTAILAPAADKNLVDALAAAPLAGQEDAPILLTDGTKLNADTKAELVKLGVSKVYVVGAIDAAVTAEVEAMDGVEAVALKGANRNATAALIAEELTSPAGTFVVGYDANADALSVASYAAANNYAIILAGPDGKLAADQKVYGTKTYVVGGTLKVADIAGATRLSGTNRYDTNKAVLNGLSYEYSKVYVANGQNGHLVDSLIASSLAAKTKSPILLTDNKTVAAAADVNKNLKSDSKVIALGGTSVVSDTVKGGVKYTAPAALAVESVSANNLSNIVVKFNKPVDDTTLTTTTVKLSVNDTNNVYVKGLSEDKTTLTLAYSSAINQSDVVKVTLDGVKDAAGVAMPKYEKSFTAVDVTAPSASSVKVLSNKKVKVSFNEPVNMATSGIYKTTDVTNSNATVKVDGNLTFAKYTSLPAENAVEIEFFNTLADGSHTMTLADAKDAAGFKMSEASFTFNTSTDSTAPVATSVTYVAKNKVEVTFNEEVTNTGTFKVYQAGDATDLYSSGTKALKTGDNKTIVLTLSTNFNVSATVGIDVKYTNVEDTFGNKTTTETTISGKASDDTAKPTVTSYEVLAGNVIKVAFSEKVDALGATSQFVLYEADGKTVVNAAASGVTNFDTTNPDGKTFKVTFAGLSNINSANYQVKVTGTKDYSIRGNVIDDYKFTVTAKDSKAPTLASAVSVWDTTGSNDKIELIFSEAMDPALAGNVANYFIGVGSANIPLNTVTDAKVDSVSADGKKVVLLVPTADTLGYNRVAMPALKDASGNYIGNASIAAPFIVAASYTPMTASDLKAEAIAKNTIKVTALNGYTFSAADANTFKFERVSTNGTNVYDLGVVAAQVSADGSYVTLTTSVALGADATYADGSTPYAVDLYVIGTTTKDMNGSSVAVAQTSSVAVADKITATQKAPTVGTGANADKITVAFDESVVLATGITNDLLASAFELKVGTTILTPVVDYTAAISSGSVVITVLKNGVSNADVTVELKKPEYLKDSVGNVVNALAVKTATGVTEKVVPTFTVNDASKTVTITFSEGVFANNDGTGTINTTDFTITDTDSSLGAITWGTYNATNRTISFTYAGTNGVDESIAANATSIYDVSGNAAGTTGVNF